MVLEVSFVCIHSNYGYLEYNDAINSKQEAFEYCVGIGKINR